MNSFSQKFRATALILALAPLAVAQNVDTALPPNSPVDESTQFARVAKDDEGRPAALQLAIVTYIQRDDPEKLTVDLVAAVHIGDQRYYEELNSRFQDYDALLYELVVREGAATGQRVQSWTRCNRSHRVEKIGPEGSPI